MWDLPGPGLEPVSPALAGGFLTTASPGKSLERCFLTQRIFLWDLLGGGSAVMKVGNTTWSLCRLPMFQLTATPASALADEPVHIRVTGLPPLQTVTLMASMKDEKGNLYQSRAFYRASKAGAGPFPGLIDLFGGIGGLVEYRASLLAAHGFAVLALAYFAYADLPKQLQEVDLEYFEEATNLLLAHPKIQKPGIGVISVSKGAEIGLAMACYLKEVAATVCINGCNAIFEFPLKYRDLVITPIPSLPERMEFNIMGALCLRHYKGNPRDALNQHSVLPIEKAQGPILFIIGEDDECFNSREYAEQALDQLRRHGRSSGRMLLYPGAGHLIEPPYLPLCYASWSRGLFCPLLWGGDPVGHAAAQEHAWGEIQKFFRQHLVQSRSTL
ncbi:acyl-coenzyme A amino acid N-acyltransferase 2-like isoform X3 [Monodon monoceros]|uniref:acyl-coenzyme A amino acid N-acyltransferase 2-like isoform X3 n=1 Tax=Monodon monoceros TaxID=40151 RepID=UPI0010F5C791|nr:acyl-coenzyme A amino acid N-acyltransferase 2-like isoform X3 [Monodon monoceros]